MNRLVVTLISLTLLLVWSREARAQSTALTVSGSPATLTITTAIAGNAPSPVTNGITTYFVKVKNIAGIHKITAQLNAPMPAGTTLTISMVAPAGATSLGAVTLDATPRDVVVNIDKENGATNTITYAFSATVAAGVVPVQSRTVTLSLVPTP